MSEWDIGEYELSARQLAEAGDRVVELLDLHAGERLLDVACGTGNLAFRAAAAGAHVTGVDLAERLLGVARGRAAAERVDVELVLGDATALPFADDAFDAAASVFGVIFAEPADAAARELVRVTRPAGRLVVTSWLESGPIFEFGAPLRAAIAEVTGPRERHGSDWSTPEGLRALFAGRDVVVHQETVAFRADSADALADSFYDKHPMWLRAKPIIGDERFEALRRQTAAIAVELNEAGPSDGWVGTSGYLAAVVSV